MWYFRKHFTAVGDQLGYDKDGNKEYGPHLHPDCDKASPSISNLLAVFRPPWPISPKQTGSILKLSMTQLCKLHEDHIDYMPPAEDFCGQLPWAFVGNRTYNLPATHGYMFRSRRVPGLGVCKRAIEGASAFWSPCSSIPVSDENGRMIGRFTSYNLVFGDLVAEENGLKSRSVVGIWRAEEYTCSDKIDGDCSLVVLYCDNADIRVLEMQIGFTEDDLVSLFERSLKKPENEQVVDQGTVSCYLHLIGTCYGQINVERAWCEEKDARMGRGVYDVEGGGRADAGEDFFNVDDLVEKQKRRKIPFGRKMQGGSRVREVKKKGGRGKRKR